MDHALAVRVRHRLAHRDHNRQQRQALVERLLVLDEPHQRLPETSFMA